MNNINATIASINEVLKDTRADVNSEAEAGIVTALTAMLTVIGDQQKEIKRLAEIVEHIEIETGIQSVGEERAPFKVMQNPRTGNYNVEGPDGTLMLVPAGELGLMEDAQEVADNMTEGYRRVTK